MKFVHVNIIMPFIQSKSATVHACRSDWLALEVVLEMFAEGFYSFSCFFPVCSTWPPLVHPSVYCIHIATEMMSNSTARLEGSWFIQHVWRYGWKPIWIARFSSYLAASQAEKKWAGQITPNPRHISCSLRFLLNPSMAFLGLGRSRRAALFQNGNASWNWMQEVRCYWMSVSF